MNVIKSISILIIVFILMSTNKCDSILNDNSVIKSFYPIEICSITIEDNKVSIDAKYCTPTPCWYYHKNKTTKTDSSYISKVYAKYDGETCITECGYFNHIHKITFPTKGNKTLKFWKNDSTFIDTMIVIQ